MRDFENSFEVAGYYTVQALTNLLAGKEVKVQVGFYGGTTKNVARASKQVNRTKTWEDLWDVMAANTAGASFSTFVRPFYANEHDLHLLVATSFSFSEQMTSTIALPYTRADSPVGFTVGKADVTTITGELSENETFYKVAAYYFDEGTRLHDAYDAIWPGHYRADLGVLDQ